MKTLKWIAAASLAVMVVACCPCRKNKSAHASFTGTEWKLVQLYGENVESDNYRVTFEADGSVSGIGDCNRFSGPYTSNAGKLSIAEHLAVTRMFCPNQQREDTFLNMLTDADAYNIDGSSLMLIRKGEVIAVFSPASGS